MRHFSMVWLLLCIVLAACGGGGSSAAPPTSPTPQQVAAAQSAKLTATLNTANNQANSKNNPNCVGDNVSPQFSWSNVPDGTNSFVLLMVDPEGRGGAGVFHWVAYGIPASVTGFAEGAVSKPSDKYVGGKSTQGVQFYSGPCTPPNTTPHHYTFILTATDFDPKELPPDLTHDEVIAKIAPLGQPPTHAKGSTGLVGLFVNPWGN